MIYDRRYKSRIWYYDFDHIFVVFPFAQCTLSAYSFGHLVILLEGAKRQIYLMSESTEFDLNRAHIGHFVVGT